MSPLQNWVWGSSAAFLALGSALFSAFETALFSLQGHEMERLRRKKTRLASALTEILLHPRKVLAVLVLGEVLMNVPLVLICLYFIHSERVPLLPLWASSLLILGLVVFICDLVPKVGAFLKPHRLVRIAVTVVSPVMHALDRPLGWMLRVSDGFAQWIIPGAPASPRALSDREMETLVEIGAEEGALHPTECAIIQEIIRLGDKTVRDCMTPRVDALCVPDDLSDKEIAERLRASRYRRVPVYGETPDEILGILDVRAFLESTGRHYTEFLSPPSFVPETMKAVDLLRSFLRRPQVLAIVVDEHGGTEGVITRSDLVEEVLAEPLPGGERELYIEELGDGRIVASGSARLEDIAEALGVEIEFEGVDTIGGLAFNVAGVLPKLGAVLLFEGLQMTVRRISRKRVVEVLVARAREGAGREEGA
jgi:CBS domain containing-hemolysin-like protein